MKLYQFVYKYNLDDKIDLILNDRKRFLDLFKKIVICQTFIRRFNAKQWYKRNIMILKLLKVQRYKLNVLYEKKMKHIREFNNILNKMLKYLNKIRNKILERNTILSVIKMQCFARQIISKNKLNIKRREKVYGKEVNDVYYGNHIINDHELVITILKCGECYLVLAYDIIECEEYECYVTYELINEMLKLYPYGLIKDDDMLYNKMVRLNRYDINKIINIIISNLKLIPNTSGVGESNISSNLPTLCIDLDHSIIDENSNGIIYNITHPKTRLLKDQAKKIRGKNLNVNIKSPYQLMKEYNKNRFKPNK